jgi:hypothetical protein
MFAPTRRKPRKYLEAAQDDLGSRRYNAAPARPYMPASTRRMQSLALFARCDHQTPMTIARWIFLLEG